DKDEARGNLQQKFHLSEIQANAILEMRLQQLANLERLRVEQEYKEKQELIKELESILASEKKMRGVVKQEILEVKGKYGDARRTQIMKQGVKDFSMEDVIPDMPAAVILTRSGYVKRVSPDEFRRQERGGKGVMGLTTKEEDEVEQIFSTSTHQDLLFFTTRGRVFKLKAYDIPETTRTSKGTALVNFLNLAPGETVSAVLPLSNTETYKYLVMATGRGTVKKTDVAEFKTIRQNGLIAINLSGGDSLGWVRLTSGSDDVMLVTAQGQSIRFSEKEIRAMGRTAAGVHGMRLRAGDAVVTMDVVTPEMAKRKEEPQLLVLTQKGFGKRTPVGEYKLQGRGGSGIRTAHVTEKTGPMVIAKIVDADDPRDLLVISTAGQIIRSPLSSVSVLGRDTQGVRVMRFKEEGDKVASSAVV
ncbi:MAG TPA: DNA gyrase C-terminal beta-propeller domain-containing protein, partial [Patescibacteria group bacterium]|nr:DNA gyrase C-terminal beta-propeller domain-containing protein [Patescibacteria group bacterium]